MINALMATGFSEEEIIKIVVEDFACGEGEAKFIIDLELGKDVGCLVEVPDKGKDDATPGVVNVEGA